MRQWPLRVHVVASCLRAGHGARNHNAFRVFNASLVPLVEFNTSTSLGIDAFTLHINLAFDDVPSLNESIVAWMCESSLLESTVALGLADSHCNGSLSLRCFGYPVSTQRSGHSVTASIDVTDIVSLHGGPSRHIVLLDLCAILRRAPVVVTGNYTWQLCSGNAVCLEDGRTLSVLWVYAALTTAWGAASLLWCAHVLFYAASTYVGLQRRLLRVPFAQILALGLLASNEMMSPSPTTLTLIQVGRGAALAVALNELLCLAYGWQITRDTFLRHRKIEFAVIATMWAAFLTLLSTTIPGEMRLVLDFLWVVMWVGFVFLLAKDLFFNIEVLRQQVLAVATSFTNVEVTPAHQKLRLFKALGSCLGYYPLIVFAVSIGLSQLPLMLTNLAPVTVEVLFLGFWVRLGFIFRCRPVTTAIFASQLPSTIAVAPAPPPGAAKTTNAILIRGPTNTTSLGTSIHPIGNFK